MFNDKQQFVETLQERTMLFQIGTEQIIWGISLNTIEIDANEVDEYLADGWFKHPFEARDAQEEEEKRLAQEAIDKAEKDRLADEEAKRLLDEGAKDAERTRLKKAADDAAAADNLLKEKLIEEAVALDVKIDKRWSTKNIQEAIDEAKKGK